MIRTATAAALALLLAGCGGSAPEPLKRAPKAVAGPARDLPARVTAHYRCEDGTLLTAVFDNRADTVTLREGGRTLGVLEGQRPASGIWYAGNGMTLRGKGRDARFEAEGRAPTQCVARD